MKKEKAAFFHIGLGKTGTSAIQAFLALNRSLFEKAGYLVPRTPGAQRHALLSLYSRADDAVAESPVWRRKQGFGTPAAMRAHLEAGLEKELSESSAANVVFSDEALYGSGPEAVRKVVDLLSGYLGRVSIVVYLRRQDDHAISRYKQTLREGKSHTIYQFIENKNNIKLWKYYEKLAEWKEELGSVELIVRPYHKLRLQRVPITADFCVAIGAPADGWIAIPGEVNPSLDAVASEFLRRFNASNGRASMQLLKRLTRVSDGPPLRLPEDVQTRFMAQFARSNENLVRTYLPGCEDIFLSPPSFHSGLVQEGIDERQLKELEQRIERHEEGAK